jgi:4-hydroxy-2-oxoheptanedioate aldolase
MRGPDGVDPSPAELEAMLQRVLAAGKKVGTPVGLHVMSTDAVKQRIAEGWQFIALASELRMMVQTAQQWVATLNLKEPAGDLARY